MRTWRHSAFPTNANTSRRIAAVPGALAIPNWEFYLIFNMFRIAAILHGVLARALQGNAASGNAVEMGRRAGPVAGVAWSMAQQNRLGECSWDFEHSGKVRGFAARLLALHGSRTSIRPSPCLAAEVVANRRERQRVGPDEGHRNAEGEGARRRTVESLPARVGITARDSPTSNTRRCARSWAGRGSRRRSFNCNAPDTGNMEVLVRYGTAEQKKRWLEPLLRGRNPLRVRDDRAGRGHHRTRPTSRRRIVRDGDHYVINGRKWWTTGGPDPRCKILIFMGKTDAANPDRHQQQSMILIPVDTPGVKLVRILPVFGYDDAPHGHGEFDFDNVRVPVATSLLGEGRGFEIAQGRLGPGASTTACA